MLPITNLTSNRIIRIRNFEEDKDATLEANRGLKYVGKNDFGNYVFCGNFYLTNLKNELIESFEIEIFLRKNYPNTFPIVKLIDNKIEKLQDFHISDDGIICFEHTYIANVLAKNGLRLFDFVNYYLPKYFSWVLVKKYGSVEELQEWAHEEAGTLELYQILLETTDNKKIINFLENFCNATKINRNDKCYCGSDRKVKQCHYKEAIFLKATSKEVIWKDIGLLKAEPLS